jgi:hypothetical protein
MKRCDVVKKLGFRIIIGLVLICFLLDIIINFEILN